MNEKDLKIFAYYLPQFHETEENNRWWGKGYTEWKNAKKAKKIFGGQYQPRQPLHDNYYNLLDDNTMKWQAKLAKDHGINGFCFYHYWFEGQKLLEKPAEKLLRDKSIDMPFCFAWANHSWTKTWEGPGGEKEVLMRQTYGQKEAWIQHFNYLLSFFKDDRYIKCENKPVLLIYQLEKIFRFSDMLTTFNEEAQKHGFDGVYIIQMLWKTEKEKKRFKFVNGYTTYVPALFNESSHKQIREIKFNMNKYLGNVVIPNKFKSLFYDIYDYNKVMDILLKRNYEKNEFMGCFPGFDNTARRGKRSWIYTGATPKKFEEYLTKIIEMSLEENKDMIFVTAWNEWGEGNYLEPDKKYGYAWLNAVKRARINSR